METRVDIVWYEWKYQISNFWRVKRLAKKETLIGHWGWIYTRYYKEAIIKWTNNGKYKFVNLPIGNWKYLCLYIHRLVWQAFLWLDINNNKMFVCHKDDNPLNNHVDNLFLGTHQDNVDDMIKKWRQLKYKWRNNWELSPVSTITNEQARNIISDIKLGIYKSVEIARRNNTTPWIVWNIKNWKAWKSFYI